MTESLLTAFAALIRAAIARHFDAQKTSAVEAAMLAPLLRAFVQDHQELSSLNSDEMIILLLALIPQIKAGFFEKLIQEQFPNGGDFPEFGGARSGNYRGMLPTGETALFILAGDDFSQRIIIQQMLQSSGNLSLKNILSIEPVRAGEPPMSGRLIVAQDWADKLLLGRETPPRFGPDFPAKRIETAMDWNDLVLHTATIKQVQEIGQWLAHQSKISVDENLGRKVKPGYRVLFYGPSGTGKTATAALLGKQFGKDVYRVDLSQVVSKYIGETEKNLEQVFKKAETKNWILFFDEADALFGKRTTTQSAHDKYANQETSYLLQRIEDYDGLLILASNFKNNLDDAFIRRFQAIVHFPLPNAQERLQLWQKAMPASLSTDETVQLKELAGKFELSGAAILNAVHFAMLQTFAAGDTMLKQTALIDGIRKEFLKEEKSF